MACASCKVEVRATFRTSPFAQARQDDLEFLEQYILAGFSIKALAEQSGLGYAAIRTRLDRLIESFGALDQANKARREVLDRLERGDISAEEAANTLKRI